MRNFSLLLFMACLLFPRAAFSFPVKVEKSLIIRSIEKGKAVQKGPYVLKAGSVIDIPDAYLVRNSIGGVDLTATLLNWKMKDSSNGTYAMLNNEHEVIGEETFFKLIILQAAPGTVLPKDFTGYVALDYLVRAKSLMVMNSPVALGVEGAHQKATNIPTPTPRPNRDEEEENQIPVPTPRPDRDSQMFDLGRRHGRSNIPIPTPRPRRSKEEVLRPHTSTPADDIKVFQKSSPIPLPTPAPRENQVTSSPPKMKEVVKVMKEASSTLPDAGTSKALCPDGKCGVALAGSDLEESLVCEQISKGHFPENLNSIRLTTNGQKIVDASLNWISRSLRDPKHCQKSCHFPDPTLFTWLNSAKLRLKDYCDSIKNCSSRCKTSEIQTTWKCTKASKSRGKECKQTCDPFLDIQRVYRVDYLRRTLDRVSTDIERHNPTYARRMKKSGIFKNMGQRLTCMNLRRENVDLEPMARNCASTAIGLGQVLVGTFYYGLGLANKTQQKNCLNYKIKDLDEKCRGWDKNAFRKEIYWKYQDYTPKELYEMRTLDVELQARSSYATFLNKLRVTGFSLKKAYRSYFGKRDTRAVNKIEACVRTGQ